MFLTGLPARKSTSVLVMPSLFAFSITIFRFRITKVVATATGKIEDSGAILQADFANEYIGGGVLTGVCFTFFLVLLLFRLLLEI
jgi:hypothetical protein